MPGERDLDEIGGGPDDEQRVVRRMDPLHQAECRFDGCHEEGDQDWPQTGLTLVFGSVIMKKMNSWYIGPVMGATSLSHGMPGHGRAQRREDR